VVFENCIAKRVQVLDYLPRTEFGKRDDKTQSSIYKCVEKYCASFDIFFTKFRGRASDSEGEVARDLTTTQLAAHRRLTFSKVSECTEILLRNVHPLTLCILFI
jgi:hypothetical protein